MPSPSKIQEPSSLPWDPTNDIFPNRANLPKIPNAPKDAAWVWGETDSLGRLNLLTPSRVKFAAQSLIRTGETTSLDLPVGTPSTPSLGRQPFKKEIIPLMEGFAYDDSYTFNTQSGTQWDGFRHASHWSGDGGIFYNGVKAADFLANASSEMSEDDKEKRSQRQIDNEKDSLEKLSIHHWAEHGLCGRGVLLDYWRYAQHHGITYDPNSAHAITYDDLVACGKYQGIDIRPSHLGGQIEVGTILFLRTGWVPTYYSNTPSQNTALAERHPNETTFAGVEQSEEMLNWLHDSYFAAVAGDSPSFEAWPPAVMVKMASHGAQTEGNDIMLHGYLLALWGVPIGEMVDLERVSQIAEREGRWEFFVSSAPFRTRGGVASWINGIAIF